MEDRELLELAAKASGVHLEWAGDQPKKIIIHWSGNPEDGGETRDWDWNPLTNDADALRLAVALCLPLEITDEVTEICPLGILEEHGSDPLAATRRAIVRAGAEMGRKMS